MSLYRYRAVDIQGHVIRGESRADNERELERRLGRLGFELLSAAPVTSALPNFMRRTRWRGRERVNFFIQLESLLRAGVPLLDALADVRDSATTPAVREVVNDLIDRIETGSTLSEALAARPAHFDSLLVGLISSGEATGRLPEVMAEIVRSLKWQDELAAKIRKAVRYPAFVGVVTVAVVGFLMIYLVPQLSTFLASMGQDLPPQTRALITISNLFATTWPILLAVAVASVFAVRYLLAHSDSVRLKRDSWVLRLPMIGEVAQKTALARFANTFALMFGSGIPVLDALGHCERAAGNLAIRDSLHRVRALVAQGAPISEALAAMEVFPSFVVRMVRVGEKSGQLDSALRNVSYFFMRDVEEKLEALQSMIEPVLTMMMGLMLGWVMFAVLGPVYDSVARFGS